MTTTVALLAANDAGRLGLVVLNKTGQVLELHTSAASTLALVEIAVGGYYEVIDCAAGLALYGKTAAGAGSANVTPYK